PESAGTMSPMVSYHREGKRQKDDHRENKQSRVNRDGQPLNEPVKDRKEEDRKKQPDTQSAKNAASKTCRKLRVEKDASQTTLAYRCSQGTPDCASQKNTKARSKQDPRQMIRRVQTHYEHVPIKDETNAAGETAG